MVSKQLIFINQVYRVYAFIFIGHCHTISNGKAAIFFHNSGQLSLK